LSAHPRHQTPFAIEVQPHVKETLVKITHIFVRGSWATDATIFQRTHELTENTERIAVMHISRKKIALEQIAVLILRSSPPKVVVKILVSLPNFAAESQVPVSIRIERDEFDRIPRIVAFRQIGQQAPILFITRKGI